MSKVQEQPDDYNFFKVPITSIPTEELTSVMMLLGMSLFIARDEPMSEGRRLAIAMHDTIVRELNRRLLEERNRLN